MDEVLKRDENDVTVLGAITNDLNEFIRMLRVDPVSGRLLIAASIPGTTDGQVKVRVDDTTFGYLSDKIAVGAGLALTVLNPGGNEQLQISLVSGGAGYDTIQNSGVSVTQRDTINLSNLLTASDVGGKTALTIDVANLAADSTFVNDLATNNTFIDDLIANTYFLSSLATSTTFIDDLVADTYFLTSLTSSTTFIDDLIGNTYFTTNLANDTNFLSTLTSNTTFISDITTIVNTDPSISIDLASQVTGVLPLINGGTGSALSDPGYNAIMGWDDTDNSVSFWHIGANLSYDHATHTLSATGGSTSPLTTKGDIYTYSTMDARLPVGTNGQVLSADSTQATGLKWINQSIGGSGGTKIAINTTQTDAAGAGGYTIPIPAGTLGTGNAIRFKMIVSSYFVSGVPDTFTVLVTYGGSTVGTITRAAVNTTSGSKGIIEGYIIADGLTNAQKCQLITAFNESTATNAPAFIQNANNNIAVDSTVNQNLVVALSRVNNGNVTIEAIIVEKIASPGENAPVNPSVQSFLFDDFIGGTNTNGDVKGIGELGWLTASNVSFGHATNDVNHPGSITWESNGLSQSYVYLGGEVGDVSSPNSTYEFMVQLSSSTDTMFVGVLDNFSSDLSGTAKGLGISNIGGHWKGIYNDGSGAVTVGSIAATTSWVKLTTVTNAAGNSAEFFVNGVSLGTIAIALTSANATITMSGFGSAPTTTYYADYFLFNRILTR